MSAPPAGLVRILAADGATAGAGFLVSDDGLIVTCTHVLGEVHADVRVVFRFGPSAPNSSMHGARVDLALTRPADAEDVAFLRLRDPVPDAVEPFALGSSRASLGGTYRTFGFPAAKPVEGMVGAIQLTGRTSEGGFEVLQLRSNEVSRGFSGAPVWDERGAVVGMVVSVARPDPLGRQTEVAFLRPVEQLIALCPRLRPHLATPYRGLAVFEEEHADDYFGRDDATRELLGKLTAHHFLAIVGVSGSGKSSLVRAGLKKGLSEFAVPGLVARCRCLVMPGSAPMLDLALALTALPDVTPAQVCRALGLGEHVLDDPGASPREVGDELARMPPDDLALGIRRLTPGGLLLVVDQFERLFTEARDVAMRRHFIDTLLVATGDDVKTLITLRADFYGLALAQPGLDGLLRDSQLTLLPMTDDELLQAIERPARRHGRRFEPGLPQRLIADVRGRPGDLPLLQFALAELWTRDADTGTLHAATYDQQLGYQAPDGRAYPGVQGAIAKRAEEIWTRLGNDERAAARRVFLSVIGTGPAGDGEDSVTADTSRRAWLLELSDLEQSVAQKLANERLLTIGRDHYSNQPTLELAHEALIRAWPLLAQWSSSFRQFLRWRDGELAPRWQHWIARDRDPELLLPSGMLDEARRWQTQYADELSPAHSQYIQASVDAWKQQTARREAELAASKRLNRRLRTLSLGLAAVVLVAGASAIVAVRAADRADSQRRLALSRTLADQALSARDRDIDLAALLSLEAFRLSAEEGEPSSEARSAVLTILQSRERTRGALTDNTPTNNAIRDERIVAFSPDGNTLATTNGEGSMRLWDVHRRTPVGRPLTGTTGRVRSMAFSADGKMLASSGSDGTVRLWDIDHRRPLGPSVEGHTDWVNGVAFSPNGKTLASAGEDGTVRLWQVHRGRRLGQPLTLAFHVGAVRSVAFSPDGAMLALALYGGASSDAEKEWVQLWDVRRRHPLGQSPVSHSGSDVVASGQQAVAFSPDGKTLASAGGKAVRLWDLTRHRPLERPIKLTGHTGWVQSVAFSGDGKMLASAGEDGTVRLWDVRARRPLRRPLPDQNNLSGSVALSPDGATLALALYGGAESVLLWDVSRRRPLGRPLTIHSRFRTVWSVAFSPDDKTLASAGDDKKVRLWDVRRGRPIGRPLTGHTKSVLSVAFSPDGKTLASAADDRTVRLWDVRRRVPGQPLTSEATTLDIARQAESTYRLAFSPDGRTLASGGVDGAVQLRDVSRRRLGRPITLTVHDGTVFGMAFSPDGKTLASASIDHTLRLVDISRRRLVGQLKTAADEESGMDGVAFSPDGKTLAFVSPDTTVQLWDVKQRRALSRPLTGHTDSVSSVAFSPDDKTLASAGHDNTVRVWDVRRRGRLGRPITLTGHTDTVESVAFSLDGALASAGGDSVRLWDPVLFSGNWRSVQRRVCAGIRRTLSSAEWSDSLPGEHYRETCPQR